MLLSVSTDVLPLNYQGITGEKLIFCGQHSLAVLISVINHARVKYISKCLIAARNAHGHPRSMAK